MEWVFDDGGRAEAGFKGTTGDCVCRAIAIATQMPYKEVYDLINQYGKAERPSKRRKGRSNARTGVYPKTIRKIMADLGWTWVPTMKIGQGCKVHLNENELPGGRLVVSISKHEVAVIDGVIHDIYDPNDRGVEMEWDPATGNMIDVTTDRCVYGYYYKA